MKTMKDLIKHLKYNRQPKEVLSLIGLLDDDNKHDISWGYYHEIWVSGELLFSINEKRNSVNPYYIRIHAHLYKTFEPSQQYKADIIIGYVSDALSHSKYSDYKIV